MADIPSKTHCWHRQYGEFYCGKCGRFVTDVFEWVVFPECTHLDLPCCNASCRTNPA